MGRTSFQRVLFCGQGCQFHEKCRWKEEKRSIYVTTGLFEADSINKLDNVLFIIFLLVFFFCWDREWVFCEIATGFVQVLKMGFIEFYRWFSFSLFLLFFHRVGRQTRAVAWLRSKT